MEVQSDKPNKSLTSSQSTYVTFENVSNQTVAVLWLNYNGDPVWYNYLRPGTSYQQQTYVTHPWVCVECDTGLFSLMKVNKQDVLFPEARNVHAVITAEETSLFHKCLAAVRLSIHQTRNVSLVEQLKESDVCLLPLPQWCVRRLLEFDSTTPPSLTEKFVKDTKRKLVKGRGYKTLSDLSL